EKAPISGAKIVLRDGDTPLATTRSDADGFASFDAPTGRRLHFEASGAGRGLAVVRSYLRGGGEASIELALPPGAPLSGCVLDATDGRPVVGASVMALNESMSGVNGQGPPNPDYG